MSRQRHPYPALPSRLAPPKDMKEVDATLRPMQERLEIITRDRGDIRDSMVSVQDLIDLGLISAVEAERLKRL